MTARGDDIEEYVMGNDLTPEWEAKMWVFVPMHHRFSWFWAQEHMTTTDITKAAAMKDMLDDTWICHALTQEDLDSIPKLRKKFPGHKFWRD